MINLKKVLVIGISPQAIQLGRELARVNSEVVFDIMIGENFNDPSHLQGPVLPDSKLSNLNFIIGRYDYVVKRRVTRRNIHSVARAQGKYTLGEWTKDYLERNYSKYDFIISTVFPFQRWPWFQQLKKKVPIFCTDKISSDLEYDKLFCKQVLQDAGVPTPKFRILDQANLVSDVMMLDFPAVVKCNVAFTHQGFGAWVFRNDKFMTILPGIQKTALAVDKEAKFYTEDFVQGPEISAHFLCNGKDWVFVGAARDYKKIGHGDTGMNTSGMGAYAPSTSWTKRVEDQVFTYMNSIMSYLGMVGINYVGFMYLGIIVDSKGVPQVIEINTRPGSPEFLAILKTIDNKDLLTNLYNASQGKDLIPIEPNGKHGVSIAVMHKNYNDNAKLGALMPDFSAVPDDVEFSQAIHLYTSNNLYGVLTADGGTCSDAAQKLYNYLDLIDCRDYFYRKDIGRLT